MAEVIAGQMSQRFDRKTALKKQAVNYYEKQCNLMGYTESGGLTFSELDKIYDNKKFGVVRVHGKPGANECMSEYKKSVFELAGDPFSRQITDMTWTRASEYGGERAAFVHALVVPYRIKKSGKILIHIVVHMPLDNTKPRAACWIDCCKGLVKLVNELRKFYPGCEFVISGDWNKNWREADERKQMVNNLCRPLKMQYVWEGEKLPKHGGTHPQPGPDSIIDGFFTTMHVRNVILLKDMPESDHRGMKGLLSDKKPQHKVNKPKNNGPKNHKPGDKKKKRVVRRKKVNK